MTVRITYLAYTADALIKLIKSGDSREAAAKAAIESAGGKLLGFYGLMGQEHDVMIISEMQQTDYMGVMASVMLGGACSDIHTVTCYTGDQARAAMAIANSTAIDYQPPS